jgi:hypothetical protein
MQRIDCEYQNMKFKKQITKTKTQSSKKKLQKNKLQRAEHGM